MTKCSRRWVGRDAFCRKLTHDESKTVIAIIGGGISGLSAALSVMREGFDVHVYEQAPSLRDALRRYERLRLPRTARIQTVARRNMTRNHLPDGPEQQERDAQMAAGHDVWSIGATAWIYDYRADEASEGYLGLPPATS